MVDCIDVVMDILSKYGICTYREIVNRCWKCHKLTNSEIKKSIENLYSKKAIERERIRNPYGTKYSFYYLPDIRSSKLRKILSYKLDLLNEHSKHNKEIGEFGEHLVGKVLENIGYDEIEYRKTQHNNIGIGRKGIDVWGNSFDEYFQNIEVKNRVQPVDIDDINSILEKTYLASEKWDLPVKSALVCSFIYQDPALVYAESKDVPVVITKKQFVPEKFREFYEKYKVAFGSYYVDIVNLQDPPAYLRDLIEEYIVWHEYDEPAVDSSSNRNEIISNVQL